MKKLLAILILTIAVSGIAYAGAKMPGFKETNKWQKAYNDGVARCWQGQTILTPEVQACVNAAAAEATRLYPDFR